MVVGSILVLTFNIGVPNYLKGFLFFAQVVGFVYRYGAANDTLTWVHPPFMDTSLIRTLTNQDTSLVRTHICHASVCMDWRVSIPNPLSSKHDGIEPSVLIAKPQADCFSKNILIHYVYI